MSKVRVAINGYGVIGKRAADAVLLQPDMELVGIADVVTDWRIQSAAKTFPIFASTDEAAEDMRRAGLPLAGSLDDLIRQVDVIADTTPKHVAAENLSRYQEAGVKTVLQGGESHETTGHSFVAQANYSSALGRDMTRVVSCNTTSIVRVLGALKRADLLSKARGVLIRRATDPWESHMGGIMNTVVPEPKIPSHQGPDAQTVLPDLDVVTMAAKGAHNQTHLHYWTVELAWTVKRADIVAALQAEPRIAFIRMSDGIAALNSTIELMKDLGRPRGDMWEVAVWEDLITVEGNEAYLTFQVDNEAIVIPETIDAIRALSEAAPDAAASMEITDRALGVQNDFLRETA